MFSRGVLKALGSIPPRPQEQSAYRCTYTKRRERGKRDNNEYVPDTKYSKRGKKTRQHDLTKSYLLGRLPKGLACSPQLL